MSTPRSEAVAAMAPLVEMRAVTKRFRVRRGAFHTAEIAAVSEVDLGLPRGTAVGLVGESGCGKSTVARLILRLLDPTAGSIRFDGTDITALAEAGLRPLRRRMQLIHQNPSAALNPRMTAFASIAEPLVVQEGARGGVLVERVAALMAEVGLPGEFLHRYPHEMSGGQRQRVCIARALALGPSLVVLDEPTSALDVSVQAQILEFLQSLRSGHGLTYLFISHNLAVVRQVCDRVAVMYLGRIVEEGPADAVLSAPLHPYAQALLAAVPRLRQGGVLPSVAGDPPNPASPPSGCAFHPRCRFAEARCRTERPDLVAGGDGERRVACHAVAEGRI